MIIGSRIFNFDNLPSTNDYAARLVKTSKPREGTIIRAGYQSAGKGQAGNRWESESNKNLLISVILFPSFIQPSDQFLISMAISLAISDFLSGYTPYCSIKWPNDIYVSDDKIAGILIENTLLQGSIINTIAGIGLNINQTRFTGNAPNPVSLTMITGDSHDPESCLTQMAVKLDKRYKQLITGEYEHLKEEYVSRLYRLNEWHKYRDKSGTFDGRIKEVNLSGIIHIESTGGTIKEYSFREVDYVLNHPPSR